MSEKSKNKCKKSIDNSCDENESFDHVFTDDDNLEAHAKVSNLNSWFLSFSPEVLPIISLIISTIISSV